MARDGYRIFDSDTHVGPDAGILANYLSAAEKTRLAGWAEYEARDRHGRAELAPVLALAFRVGDASAAPGGAIGRPARQALPVGGAQIGFEDQGVGADMGVGIEDPVAVARHQLLRYFASAASDR